MLAYLGIGNKLSCASSLGDSFTSPVLIECYINDRQVPEPGLLDWKDTGEKGSRTVGIDSFGLCAWLVTDLPFVPLACPSLRHLFISFV